MLVLILLKSWYSCSFSNTCSARAIWAGGKFGLGVWLGFAGVVGVVESLLESPLDSVLDSWLGFWLGGGVGLGRAMPISIGTSFKSKSKCTSQFGQHHSFSGSMLKCVHSGLFLLISINSLQ